MTGLADDSIFAFNLPEKYQEKLKCETTGVSVHVEPLETIYIPFKYAELNFPNDAVAKRTIHVSCKLNKSDSLGKFQIYQHRR